LKQNQSLEACNNLLKPTITHVTPFAEKANPAPRYGGLVPLLDDLDKLKKIEIEMNTLSMILLSIAVVSAICGVVSAVMIAASLQKRGFKVNWIWLRVLILSKYLDQYRDVTREETGRPGLLFYSYIIAMNFALVTGIAGLILRSI
jgi:hypothetical protein